MSSPDQAREQELAELLREVRALRETIDQLKAGPALQPRLPPDYAVLVRQAALPPDYTVAVRIRPTLPPDYAVLVRSLEPPSYEVLVRPATPPIEEPPVAGP